MSIMNFCPKCSSLLQPTNHDNKLILKCSCGYTQQLETSNIKENYKTKSENLNIRSSISPLATQDHICKKCGFNKAELQIQDIASMGRWCGDQDGKAFLKCGKCGFKEEIS